MNPRSRLGQTSPSTPASSGVAALVGELPPIPRWVEIAGGVCIALVGVVAVAGMLWGGW